MKTQDIKNMASAYMQVQEKAKMDPVDKKALKKDFDDRKDKDIDNDGDVDSSDEYLHKRRKAITKSSKDAETETVETKEDVDLDEGAYVGGPKHTFPQYIGGINSKQAKAVKKHLTDKGHSFDDHSHIDRNKKADTHYISMKTKEGHAELQKAKAKYKVDDSEQRRKNLAARGVKEEIYKEDVDMTNTKWPIYNRIMEKAGSRDDHVKGATDPEPIDSKASPKEKEFVQKHGGLDGNDSGIDGAKAAADTAKAATAQVKTAPGRPNDKNIGDKKPIDSTKA